MNEADVRAKLRKIEALFARAGTEGERMAAKSASERVRSRREGLLNSDKPIELS